MENKLCKVYPFTISGWLTLPKRAEVFFMEKLKVKHGCKKRSSIQNWKFNKTLSEGRVNQTSILPRELLWKTKSSCTSAIIHCSWTTAVEGNICTSTFRSTSLTCWVKEVCYNWHYKMRFRKGWFTLFVIQLFFKLSVM